MCSPIEFDIGTFDITKNYVIEASAGTGKTYTIVEMVKKLLKEGITLDKMLIVTYTEKAAGELKDRIRTGLSTLDDGIKGKPENDVDKASIGTIHSFCQNIIDEYFISAGKPSCQTLIGEGEIKEFLKRYLRQGEIYADICEYKKSCGENIEEKLSKKIVAYINKYYLTKKNVLDSTIVMFDELESAFFCGNILQYPAIRDALSQLRSSNDLRAVAFCNDLDLTTLAFNGNSYQERYFRNPADKNAFKEIKKAKDTILKIDNFFDETTFKYLSPIYIAWQKEKENLCEQTYNDMIRNVREEVVNGKKLLEKIKEKYTYAIIDEFQDTNQKQWDIFKTAFLCEGHHIIVVGDPKQSIFSFQGADVTVYEKARVEIITSGGESCCLYSNYRATEDIIKSANDFFDNATNPSALSMSFTSSNVGNLNYKVEYNNKDNCKAYWITENEVTSEEYVRIVCNRIVDFCTLDESGKTKLQIWDKDGNQRDVSFKDFAVLARTRSEMKPIQEAFEKCGIPYTQYKDTGLFSGRECANWIAILEAINAPDFTGKNREYFRKAMFTYFFGYSLDDIGSPYFDKDSSEEINQIRNWQELANNREWSKLIEKIIVDTNVANKMKSLSDVKAFGVLLQIGDYCVDYLNKTNNLEMLIKNLRKQANGSNDEEEEENSGIVAKSTDLDCVQIMTIHASKGLEFPIVISVSGFKATRDQESYSYHGADGKHYLTFSSNDTSTNEAREEFQRLYYVAYTRAKYLLMLPLHPTPYKGSYPDKKLSFIFQSIDTFEKNHTNKETITNPDGTEEEKITYTYQPMPLATDDKSLDGLKDSVKTICEQNKNKMECEKDEFEKRNQELNKFGKTVYFHTSQKHAYSSLSHGSEKIIVEANASITDTDVIENDVLKHDNSEEEPMEVGLSSFDNSAKQIDCSYDVNKKPIGLSSSFISGASLGNALHRVFELIDYQNPEKDLEKLIQQCFEEQKIHWKDEWIGNVKDMVTNVLGAKLPSIHGDKQVGDDFSLNSISFGNRKNEVEFNFNILSEKITNLFNHYMNGFVDLIIKRGEYYSILDWKSDKLREEGFTCYNDKGVVKEHVDELYSIQRVLYSYCLIKWLKQFYKDKTEQEIFEEHFGGIYYVFLRGCNENTGNGIYAQTWESFEELEKAYNNIVGKKVH